MTPVRSAVDDAPLTRMGRGEREARIRSGRGADAAAEGRDAWRTHRRAAADTTQGKREVRTRTRGRQEVRGRRQLCGEPQSVAAVSGAPVCRVCPFRVSSFLVCPCVCGCPARLAVSRRSLSCGGRLIVADTARGVSADFCRRAADGNREQHYWGREEGEGGKETHTTGSTCAHLVHRAGSSQQAH